MNISTCDYNSKAWAARAEDLANWVWLHMVNRVHAYGEYRPLSEWGKEYVKPDGSIGQLGRIKTTKVLLTKARLVRHFCAGHRSDLVGLLTTSRQNTSRWGAIEIDWHGGFSSAPELNWAAALAWYGLLRILGFRPLLVDSNGQGGFHLFVLFSEPVPTPLVFAFLRWLTGDYSKHGLPDRPEHFPKQARIEAGQFGNWLRLPGRHHTRDHWSRVWDSQQWLEGDAAIDFMLALSGDAPSLIPDEAAAYEQPQRVSNAGTYGRSVPVTAADLSRRIATYAAKLRNLAEGYGRDKVAYSFAGFLVRDLQLSDDAAMPWLMHWDARNQPPKGEQRLREIIANVHKYGTRPYGSGYRSRRADTACFSVRV